LNQKKKLFFCFYLILAEYFRYYFIFLDILLNIHHITTPPSPSIPPFLRSLNLTAIIPLINYWVIFFLHLRLLLLSVIIIMNFFFLFGNSIWKLKFSM